MSDTFKLICIVSLLALTAVIVYNIPVQTFPDGTHSL